MVQQDVVSRVLLSFIFLAPFPYSLPPSSIHRCNLDPICSIVPLLKAFSARAGPLPKMPMYMVRIRCRSRVQVV